MGRAELLGFNGAGNGGGGGDLPEAGQRVAKLAEEPLWGRSLRFVLVGELMVRREMTVAEMVGLVAAHGFRLPGRASKVISDSLRWEVLRGRVARVARGVYRYVGAPRSTARRIRMFSIRCLAWAAAACRGLEPPPPPRTRPNCTRRPNGIDRTWRNDPPWSHLCWLWLS